MINITMIEEIIKNRYRSNSGDRRIQFSEQNRGKIGMNRIIEMNIVGEILEVM